MYFSFSTFFSVSCHIQGHTCVCFIFHIFQFSRHNPGPTVCFSHFSHFSVFRAIFHVLLCVFLILHDFQVSLHIPGPTMCISHFAHFSMFLVIFQVLQCTFLIFHVFECFSPYSRSYSFCVSFTIFTQSFSSYSRF